MADEYWKPVLAGPKTAFDTRTDPGIQGEWLHGLWQGAWTGSCQHRYVNMIIVRWPCTVVVRGSLVTSGSARLWNFEAFAGFAIPLGTHTEHGIIPRQVLWLRVHLFKAKVQRGDRFVCRPDIKQNLPPCPKGDKRVLVLQRHGVVQ